MPDKKTTGLVRSDHIDLVPAPSELTEFAEVDKELAIGVVAEAMQRLKARKDKEVAEAAQAAKMQAAPSSNADNQLFRASIPGKMLEYLEANKQKICAETIRELASAGTSYSSDAVVSFVMQNFIYPGIKSQDFFSFPGGTLNLADRKLAINIFFRKLLEVNITSVPLTF